MKTRILAVLLSFLFLPFYSAYGDKEGMPQLCQDGNTCLPTSTTQLLLWFSWNGSPKLVSPGLTRDEAADRLLHQVMTHLGSTFDVGVSIHQLGQAIPDLVHQVGYDCDVNFFGVNCDQALTPEVLEQNDDPHTGFILVVAPIAVMLAGDRNCYAVTLISYDPDGMVVQDSARYESDPGRRILKPEILSDDQVSDFQNRIGYTFNGLIKLTGSPLLAYPNETSYLLFQAIGITMHPVTEKTPQVAQLSEPSPPWYMWYFLR